MISSWADVVAAEAAGQSWIGYLRRAGPAMTAGIYADLSYAAGIPVANYYFAAPLTGAVLNTRDGIDLGPEPAAGLTKYLRRVMLMPPTATGILSFEFIDIVLYYPGVDGDGGSQDMSNPTPIPRYSGRDCKIMVVSQGVGTGWAQCRITYTDSDGTPGKQVTVSLNLAAPAGSLCSSTPSNTSIATAPNMCGPFLPWAVGSNGVRSIENVEYITAGGGIAAFVIVKPLMQMGMSEATVAPIEVDTFVDRAGKMPELPVGAFLHAIAIGTTSSTPATLTGEIESIWG